MLRFVRDVRSCAEELVEGQGKVWSVGLLPCGAVDLGQLTKVTPNNAVPGRVVLLVELLLDVSGDVLLDVVLLESLVDGSVEDEERVRGQKINARRAFYLLTLCSLLFSNLTRASETSAFSRRATSVLAEVRSNPRTALAFYPSPPGTCRTADGRSFFFGERTLGAPAAASS